MFIVVTSLLATGVSGKIQRLRKPDGKIIPVANSVDHVRYSQDSRISNLRKLADDIQRQAARELKQMSVSNPKPYYLSTIEILQWRFHLIAYLLSSSSQVSSSTSSCDDEDYEVRCIAVRLSGNQRSSPTCIKAIEDLAEALDDLNDKDMEKLDDYDEYDEDCDDGQDMLREIQDRRYRRDLSNVDTHLRELKKGGKKKNKKSSSDCSSRALPLQSGPQWYCHLQDPDIDTKLCNAS